MKASSLLSMPLALVTVVALNLTPASAAGSGNCLDFDGINDNLGGGGFPVGQTSITLEAWVYHRTLPAHQQRYVWLELSGGGEVACIRHDGATSQGQLHFYISTGGTYRHLRVDGVLQTNRWYHVTGTWDGSTQRLYLNGESVASSTPGGTLDVGSGFAVVSDYNEPMDGYIDEVRIWNYARNAQEIGRAMYKELGGTESGLLGYWKFNESSGILAHDSAGTCDLPLIGGMTDDDWVTSGAFCGPRNALDFDGTNDYVAVADANSLDLTSNYTLECWFKADGFGGLRGLISKYQTSGANGYLLPSPTPTLTSTNSPPAA